jgi:hypothetical protein
MDVTEVIEKVMPHLAVRSDGILAGLSLQPRGRRQNSRQKENPGEGPGDR